MSNLNADWRVTSTSGAGRRNMKALLEPFTTLWQQYLGDGDFAWVRSFTGTRRSTADGHFKVTILVNHREDGLVEHRLLLETEEDYSPPDMMDAWREDVITPANARERASLILEACDEIALRESREETWVRGVPPTAVGSQWGARHVKAVARYETEIADEWANFDPAAPENRGTLRAKLWPHMSKQAAISQSTTHNPSPPDQDDVDALARAARNVYTQSHTRKEDQK